MYSAPKKEKSACFNDLVRHREDDLNPLDHKSARTLLPASGIFDYMCSCCQVKDSE